MPVWSCAACAVEYPDTVAPPARCPLCEDERQYVPRSGQAWTSLDELSRAGNTLVIDDVEPGLYGVSTSPRVGIGQRAFLVQTEAGICSGIRPGSSTRRVRNWCAAWAV